MKLRNGDVVLLKATIHLVEPEAIFVIIGGETRWSGVDPRAVDRVLRQHLEPGDMVQGGKVLMLWPEDEPTHVVLDIKDGAPVSVPLASPSAQRIEETPEPMPKVPLFPDPEPYPEPAPADYSGPVSIDVEV